MKRIKEIYFTSLRYRKQSFASFGERLPRRTLLAMTLGFCSFLPTNVLAALGDDKLTENDSGSLLSFLGSIQDWLLTLVGGLAVLFIVYGGFLYITSGGNKERIESAKKTLTYAILGLILVVLSGTILSLLTGDFSSSIFGNSSL